VTGAPPDDRVPPGGSEAVTVRLLRAEETYVLRRAALRGDDPTAVVHQETDEDLATFHLGAVAASGRVVGTSTFFPEPFPLDPWRPGAYRLRSMAVDHAWRGRGIGTLVLQFAEARLVGLGARMLWANARDSALGFYDKVGFTRTPRSFVDSVTRLAHTVVVRDLEAGRGAGGRTGQVGAGDPPSR
jgi:GNAT superfamily N-acetyltransferase